MWRFFLFRKSYASSSGDNVEKRVTSPETERECLIGGMIRIRISSKGTPESNREQNKRSSNRNDKGRRGKALLSIDACW